MTTPPGDLAAELGQLRDAVHEMVAMLNGEDASRPGQAPRPALTCIEGEGRDQSGPAGQLRSVGVNKRDPRTGQPPVSPPRSGHRAGRQQDQ